MGVPGCWGAAPTGTRLVCPAPGARRGREREQGERSLRHVRSKRIAGRAGARLSSAGSALGATGRGRRGVVHHEGSDYGRGGVHRQPHRGRRHRRGPRGGGAGQPLFRQARERPGAGHPRRSGHPLRGGGDAHPGRRLRRGDPPGGPDRRAQVGLRPALRRGRQPAGDAQPPRGLGCRRREALPLRLLRRRLLRRAGRLSRAGVPSDAAGLALRRLQGGRRALPGLLRLREEALLVRAPLRQRLRAAAGSPRRGGRGRHLHRQVPQGRVLHHLRRRQPDPRLRLRGRRGPGQRPRPDQRLRGPAQRGHRRRDRRGPAPRGDRPRHREQGASHLRAPAAWRAEAQLHRPRQGGRGAPLEARGVAGRGPGPHRGVLRGAGYGRLNTRAPAPAGPVGQGPGRPDHVRECGPGPRVFCVADACRLC